MYTYPNAIRSKLPKVGTNIFTVMSKLANEHEAINLSQGFPDFPVSQELINLVHQHMNQGRNQYPPMAGIPELETMDIALLINYINHQWGNDGKYTDFREVEANLQKCE